MIKGQFITKTSLPANYNKNKKDNLFYNSISVITSNYLCNCFAISCKPMHYAYGAFLRTQDILVCYSGINERCKQIFTLWEKTFCDRHGTLLSFGRLQLYLVSYANHLFLCYDQSQLINSSYDCFCALRRYILHKVKSAEWHNTALVNVVMAIDAHLCDILCTVFLHIRLTGIIF